MRSITPGPMPSLHRQLHIIWLSIAIPAVLAILVTLYYDTVVIESLRTVHWLVPTGSLLVLIAAVALGVQRVKTIARMLEEREQLLQAANRQLITADRLASAGMMAASIAHEVNNPLTTIKILIHALKERLPELPDARDDLDIIQGEIDKISMLVLRLMQFARPTEPELTMIDINPTLARVVELIRPKAKAADVDVVEDHMPVPQVRADPAQLGQVFLNILLNAVDATPKGGVIRVTSHAEKTGGVGVIIWNSGPGLDPALAERIFDPFFTTKASGTGLGLPIARLIIDKHGGDIRAIGHGVNGTTFHIILPQTQVASTKVSP